MIVKNKSGTGDADGYYSINLDTQPARGDYKRKSRSAEMAGQNPPSQSHEVLPCYMWKG